MLVFWLGGRLKTCVICVGLGCGGGGREWGESTESGDSVVVLARRVLMGVVVCVAGVGRRRNGESNVAWAIRHGITSMGFGVGGQRAGP